MVLDIITAALIVVPMGIGMAKGFLYISMRFLGWIGAVAGGFLLAPTLRQLLEKGAAGEWIRHKLEAHFEGTTEGVDGMTDGLPSILGSAIDQTVNNTVDLMVTALAGLILTVGSFLMIVVMVRLLLIFVIRPLSKLRSDSPVSFANKFLGMLVGGAEGLLLAFLFLAALIPVMNMGSPETAAAIADALKYSHLAGTLYDGNFLLVLFG